MPSDHVIADLDAFHAAIRAALPMVSQGWLATFGISPDKPETGYGWIQVGREIAPGSTKSRASSKSPAWNGPKRCWRAATMLGTAASSCSAPTAIWRNWASTLPKCSSPPKGDARRHA
jgi:mannose-1-phosphate guanylyltransferase